MRTGYLVTSVLLKARVSSFAAPSSVPEFLMTRLFVLSSFLDMVIYGGFPKLGVPFLGVPIIRNLVYWGLYWGHPILGKYHIWLHLQV